MASLEFETCSLKLDGPDFEASNAQTHIFFDCEPEVSPTLVTVSSAKFETCSLKLDGPDFETSRAPTHIFSDYEPEVSLALVT